MCQAKGALIKLYVYMYGCLGKMKHASASINIELIPLLACTFCLYKSSSRRYVSQKRCLLCAADAPPLFLLTNVYFSLLMYCLFSKVHFLFSFNYSLFRNENFILDEVLCETLQDYVVILEYPWEKLFTFFPQ